MPSSSIISLLSLTDSCFPVWFLQSKQQQKGQIASGESDQDQVSSLVTVPGKEEAVIKCLASGVFVACHPYWRVVVTGLVKKPEQEV